MHTWLRFWFGDSCRLCHSELLPHESGICIACKGLLPFAWLNDRIHIPADATTQPLDFQVRSWLLFSEHNAVRQLIHRIKYKADRSLAFDLGQAMGQDLGSIPGTVAARSPAPQTLSHARLQPKRIPGSGLAIRSGWPGRTKALKKRQAQRKPNKKQQKFPPRQCGSRLFLSTQSASQQAYPNWPGR